jgi:hypothetical protein
MIDYTGTLDQLLFPSEPGMGKSGVVSTDAGAERGSWARRYLARPVRGNGGFRRKDESQIALAGLVALALGSAASDLVKELTTRPRSFLSLPNVRLLVSPPHSYAFPSGHTTSAFTAASGVVLAGERLLGRVPLWGWVKCWRSTRRSPTRASTSASITRQTLQQGMFGDCLRLGRGEVGKPSKKAREAGRPGEAEKHMRRSPGSRIPTQRIARRR